MGIYEVLGNSPDVQKLIVSSATSDVINQQAIKEGMISMQLDGFIKALRGQTTIEETIPAQQGEATLTIEAVDKAQNVATKEQKINDKNTLKFIKEMSRKQKDYNFSKYHICQPSYYFCGRRSNWYG